MTGVKIRSFTPLLGGWASNRRPNRAAAATRYCTLITVPAGKYGSMAPM
jgi:hypothetical protein